MLENLTSSTRHTYFLCFGGSEQWGMAGVRGSQLIAKAGVPASDVSVLPGFEAKWVSENWREHWTLCFWSFSYSASGRVSGTGIGGGRVERLPFLFYHTRVEPPLPEGFGWQEWLCAVHKAIQGYMGQYGRIGFCINAHNLAGHKLQSPLRAFRRGGEEMS